MGPFLVRGGGRGGGFFCGWGGVPCLDGIRSLAAGLESGGGVGRRLASRPGVETFAGICARPPVLLRFRRQACLDRIVLDIGSYSRMLAFVADPMVVGFPLPERLPGETKDAVCFVGGGSLHRLQQTAWMDFGEQQGVDVIRHDDECSQFEVAQGDAFVQGIDHDAGDGGLTQIHGPARGLVQVAIDPNERFTGRSFGRGWETAMRETAMEVPGEE